jgi:type IV pilus biogenesis protein CpaD/CtpE
VSGDNSILGQSRSARVRDALSRAGLETAPGVDVNLAPNTVGLVLSESVVVPPHCGDWPIFAGDAPSNAPSLYLGCALRNNLYRQVVDKRDLAVGQTPGPADAEPGMRAVQKYREGLTDKSKTDSPSANNAAADSATGAAQAASGMADNPLSPTGNGNGQ